MNDLKDQLNERKAQVEELQLQLGKREEELAQSLMRIDEEGAGNIFLYIIFNRIFVVDFSNITAN